MAKNIHWLAPATMLGSLAAGIALAIGHHIFYSHLAGQEAPSGSYRLGIFAYSRQEANIQLGTAFAFLVKATLVVAVVTVYVQLFWCTILRQKTGEGTRLSHIDTAFSVIDNVFDLLWVKVWLKRPFLMLLAIIAWSVTIKISCS